MYLLTLSKALAKFRDTSLLDENSMGSKMESKTPPNLNPSSFLGMAAAGLMDPSAAKGTFSVKLKWMF